jgi:uncharacterized membrane protein
VNTFVIIGLGLIAGLRAAIAPAVLSHYLSQRPPRSIVPPVSLLSKPQAAGALKVLAVTELVGDVLAIGAGVGLGTQFDPVSGR